MILGYYLRWQLAELFSIATFYKLLTWLGDYVDFKIIVEFWFAVGFSMATWHLCNYYYDLI